MVLRTAVAVLAGIAIIGCAPLPPLIPDSTPADVGTIAEEQSPPAESTAAVIQDIPHTDSSVIQPPEVVVPVNTASGRFLVRPLPDALRRPLRIGLVFGKARLRLQASQGMRLTADQSTVLENSEFRLEAGSGTIRVLDKAGTLLATARKVVLTPESGDYIRMDGKGYRGALEVTSQGNGMQAVNNITMEDYLRGVVPHEIGKLDASGIEALKAQSVAARTYAFKHFGSRSSLGFDMYADTRDQVYEGRDGEYALANQAVDATTGVVMEYQGKLIEAYYHSTCAGHTESLQTWDKPDMPYMRARSDLDPSGQPYCAESKAMTWEVRFTESELASVIQRNAKEAKADRIFAFQAVEKIFVLDRLPGGRVGNLLVATDNGTLQVKGDRTRWLFKQGGKILPSAWFHVHHENGVWIFQGKGLGHGIGMCQMGARGRSRAGQSYQDILWHYYNGIDLVSYQP